jgi:hypothetical protein
MAPSNYPVIDPDDPRMYYARHYSCPDCHVTPQIHLTRNLDDTANVGKLYVSHMSWCKLWEQICRDYPRLVDSILSEAS